MIKEKDFLEKFKNGEISIQITTLSDYNKFILYISKQFKNQRFPIKKKIEKPFKIGFSKNKQMLSTTQKKKIVLKTVELNFIGNMI